MKKDFRNIKIIKNRQIERCTITFILYINKLAQTTKPPHKRGGFEKMDGSLGLVLSKPNVYSKF